MLAYRIFGFTGQPDKFVFRIAVDLGYNINKPAIPIYFENHTPSK
jgi:hypothetical protein